MPPKRKAWKARIDEYLCLASGGIVEELAHPEEIYSSIVVQGGDPWRGVLESFA